jgi:uncharacterized protein (TIGR02646 family)
MMKIERPQVPQWLEENYERWGQQWLEQLLDPARSNSFQWYQYRSQKINQLLLPLLSAITDNHCSFCDKRPVGVETVDHFRPKTAFPLDAYVWNNLFIACYDCQVSRWEEYDPLLIKPDDEEYLFNTYFRYNPVTGALEPAGALDSNSYHRANVTIQLFKLNERGLPEARKLISDNKEVFSEYNLDLVPYRFVFGI